MGNTGTYRKLPSGNWLGQAMDGYKENGKKNIVNVTAPTKSEAKEAIRKYFADKEAGALLQKKMSFSQWAKTWYADYQGQVQPSTYSGYQYTLKYLTDYFGDKPISDIKQIDINRFLAKLHQDGLSHSLQAKCKAMLIQIFTAAEDNDLVLKNPALHAMMPRDFSLDPTANKKDAFTDEEFETLMSKLPDTLIGNSIRTLLVSGLRVQELLALTPEDIEEDGSVIHVRKAVKMVDGKPKLGPPKSKQSRREIPIPADYRQYVRCFRDQGGKVFLWTSMRSESLLYGVGSFRKAYYRTLKNIPGIRLLSPHCCRHTYVTRLQAKGVPMEIIARLAGHSDIATTDGYTHTSIDTLKKAVSVLDNCLTTNNVDVKHQNT